MEPFLAPPVSLPSCLILFCLFDTAVLIGPYSQFLCGIGQVWREAEMCEVIVLTDVMGTRHFKGDAKNRRINQPILQQNGNNFSANLIMKPP